MKHDDASWHYGGNFPKELPQAAGATHIGMFVSWLFLGGYVNPDEPVDVGDLEQRRQTPGNFVMTQLDEKFMDFFFSEEIRPFIKIYYDFSSGAYLGDYEKTLAEGKPTLYHVEDSWQNYDLVRPVFDQRYAEWSGQ